MTCVHCGEPILFLYGQWVHNRRNGDKSVRCQITPPTATPYSVSAEKVAERLIADAMRPLRPVTR